MFNFYPSQIIEYLYCPRYTYFEYVLRVPQQEDKYYKVQKGREVHNQKLEQNKDYLRKKIGVIAKWQDQYLGMPGLRGKVDEVLQLNNQSLAPLDYKFAEWNNKVYNTYKIQLIAYALLIEYNYSKPVEKGFLVYTRSANKLVEIEIKEKDKNELTTAIENMSKIIGQNHFPKATSFKKRCLNCTYRNICIQ
ncbi:MAG: CRISPR-associated protein Cas4 [Bacteroidetes bacterium]|nr:CRISPR-associated protein Cas4 [Bacteroidota bacterium]